MVELIGNDGLPAIVQMHMTDGLFARLVQLCKRLNGCPAIALSFRRQPPVTFGSADVNAHVVSAANRERHPAESAANEMWSMDFVSDACSTAGD